MSDPQVGFDTLLQHVAAWFEAWQHEKDAGCRSEAALADSAVLSESQFRAACLPIEEAGLVTDRAYRKALATARRLHRAQAFRTFLAIKAPECVTPAGLVDFLYGSTRERAAGL